MITRLWRALEVFLIMSLRGLFVVARMTTKVDRAFVSGLGEPFLVAGRTFAQAIARAHRGNAQDMMLLYTEKSALVAALEDLERALALEPDDALVRMIHQELVLERGARPETNA